MTLTHLVARFSLPKLVSIRPDSVGDLEMWETPSSKCRKNVSLVSFRMKHLKTSFHLIKSFVNKNSIALFSPDNRKTRFTIMLWATVDGKNLPSFIVFRGMENGWTNRSTSVEWLMRCLVRFYMQHICDAMWMQAPVLSRMKPFKKRPSWILGRFEIKTMADKAKLLMLTIWVCERNSSMTGEMLKAVEIVVQVRDPWGSNLLRWVAQMSYWGSGRSSPLSFHFRGSIAQQFIKVKANFLYDRIFSMSYESAWQL